MLYAIAAVMDREGAGIGADPVERVRDCVHELLEQFRLRQKREHLPQHVYVQTLLHWRVLLLAVLTPI